ncbi:hypothetical protein [Nonomuraea ceibae]|uniref:hypothetical protein n=1 Tax=Nonomuraea ceibae TaxID=1935170 RepID=UPI001C5E3692|nr:hypothetical protein [Nonomuraea ceibae]
MARNGSDDALRRGTTGVEAVEGLLAYATTRRGWGGGGLRSADRAVALSRALVAENPAHTPLLARALRTAARLHLGHRRPADALPLAAESVELARQAGGPALVLSLACLAEVYESLQRYGDAAAALSEADGHTPPA